MRHGKLITEECNIAKRQCDKHIKLSKALQKAKASGVLVESDAEIKSLSLEEVAKRLTKIQSNKSVHDWTDLDNARWQRLAWRAKHLGVNNPFSLIKN